MFNQILASMSQPDNTTTTMINLNPAATGILIGALCLAVIVVIGFIFIKR